MLEGLEKVFQIPARFIDVNYQNAVITNITTKDGVAKDISVGEYNGFGVRVLDKVWGFASSNDPKDLLDAANKAYKAARVGDKDIHFVPRDGVEDRVSSKAKIQPESVSLEEKMDLGKRAFDSIKGEKLVVSSSFTYVDAALTGLYASSEGTNIEFDSTRVAFMANVFAKKNGTLQFAGERTGATAGFDFLKDPEDVAKKASAKALRLLNAQDAPSGRFTVVLDPLLTGVFIHEALGHAVEADHIIQGDSILEGRMGESND
jgi:TldD protein